MHYYDHIEIILIATCSSNNEIHGKLKDWGEAVTFNTWLLLVS